MVDVSTPPAWRAWGFERRSHIQPTFRETGWRGGGQPIEAEAEMRRGRIPIGPPPKPSKKIKIDLRRFFCFHSL